MNFINSVPPEFFRSSGVYRLVFEDGSFYVGCSKNLRERYNQWVFDFRSKSRLSAKVLERMLISAFVKMELIEVCSVGKLKQREAFYLKKYSNDPRLLSVAHFAWQPVLQYNIAGDFITKHPSIGAAAKRNSFALTKVQEVLDGRRLSYKGMIFRYKEGDRLPHSRPDTKISGKLMQLYLDDTPVATYLKYIDAARAAGCSPRNIRRVVAGEQHTAGGYKWALSSE